MARLASVALAGAAALALLAAGVPALAQPPATHHEKIEYARCIAWGRELPVPRYSQNIHKGRVPRVRRRR